MKRSKYLVCYGASDDLFELLVYDANNAIVHSDEYDCYDAHVTLQLDNGDQFHHRYDEQGRHVFAATQEIKCKFAVCSSAEEFEEAGDHVVTVEHPFDLKLKYDYFPTYSQILIVDLDGVEEITPINHQSDGGSFALEKIVLH